MHDPATACWLTTSSGDGVSRGVVLGFGLTGGVWATFSASWLGDTPMRLQYL